MSTPAFDPLLEQADALVRAGRLAEAEACAAQALAGEPRNPRAHFVMAVCRGETGRLEEAIDSYRQLLELHPRSFDALANLGSVFQRIGRLDDAVACYRAALAVRPDEPVVLNALGYLHAKLGRAAESIDAYERAVQVSPGYTQAWISLGETLFKVREDERAVAALDRALALEPGNEAVAFLRDSIAGVQVAHPPPDFVMHFFDGFAEDFDRKLRGELEYRAPEAVATLLAPWLAAHGELRVLDLGCGTGLSGEIVRHRARELVGVDLSARMLEKARARGIYDRLEQAEIGAFLQRRDARSVDLALALDVLIYVGRLEAVMPLVAKALAPQGLFVFTVEHLEDSAGDVLLARTGRYAHSNAYVERLAKAAGLRVAHREAFTLRKESGIAVPGVVYTLQHREATAG